jgi:hypothetical protein
MSHTPRETGALAGLKETQGRPVCVWIAETSQASRLARLASQGLGLPRPPTRAANAGARTWAARPTAPPDAAAGPQTPACPASAQV